MLLVSTPQLCRCLLRTLRSGHRRHVVFTSARSVSSGASPLCVVPTSLPDQSEQLWLLPGQVDVWWLKPEEVQDGNLTKQYLQLLPPAEQQYVSEAASAEIQKERLLARTLQRTVLARYCSESTDPPSLQFERNGHGKPRLSWEESHDQHEPQVHFSLTHTRSLLGIAVSCGSPVGLDVEAANRYTKTDVLKLAKRRFAPAELANLEEVQDATKRARRFVQLWTLKEAFVKALGQGINAAPGLKGFSVVLQQDSNKEPCICQLTGSSSADTAYRIQFKTQQLSHNFEPNFVLFSPCEGHIAALCMQRQDHNQLSRQSSTGSDMSSSTVLGDDSQSSFTTSSNIADCNDSELAPLVRFFETVPLVSDKICHCQLVGSTGLM